MQEMKAKASGDVAGFSMADASKKLTSMPFMSQWAKQTKEIVLKQAGGSSGSDSKSGWDQRLLSANDVSVKGSSTHQDSSAFLGM